MQSTKILPNIQNTVNQLFKEYPAVMQIINQIYVHGGQAFLVGGAVRDIVLSLLNTTSATGNTALVVPDIDIEVHGLDFAVLEKLLASIGHVNYVGKSFGVLKINSLPIDWSMPRNDSAGRKPLVSVNPHMGIVEALRRRDLTMNALAIHLKTFELIDPFGGLQDIQNGVLRAPDTSFFTQDPLRFYRVMQFVGRFAMVPDAALTQLCKQMDISQVSIERIEGEFEKLLLKSVCPALGIRWLLAVDRLREIMPELANTIGVEQEPEWHPEGDVFEHSMQTVDAAAALTYIDQEEKLICLYSALCHDLGKAVTTAFINGRLRSHGHDTAGGPLAQALLGRITTKKRVAKTVSMLVEKHMQPVLFITQHAGAGAYKRLAHYVAGYATLRMLAQVSLADRRGRNVLSGSPLTIAVPEIDAFIEQATRFGVLTTPEQPILHGKDIADLVEPGPLMGKLLTYAFQIQLAENIQDKEQLKQLLAQKLQEYKK